MAIVKLLHHYREHIAGFSKIFNKWKRNYKLRQLIWWEYEPSKWNNTSLARSQTVKSCSVQVEERKKWITIEFRPELPRLKKRKLHLSQEKRLWIWFKHWGIVISLLCPVELLVCLEMYVNQYYTVYTPPVRTPARDKKCVFELILMYSSSDSAVWLFPGLAEETLPPGSRRPEGALLFLLLRPLQLQRAIAGIQDGHAGGLCHHAVHQHAARSHTVKSAATDTKNDEKP